jgi:hypothetical protein
LPAGKEHLINDDNGDWKRDGRQSGKAAKVIKKLFCERFKKYLKEADFECFSNQYKAEYNEDGYTFDLRPNVEIPDVYDMGRKNGGGSLNSSCMNGDTEYLEIYKHCNSLQILTLTNANELLCGRALIWKVSNEITLMDRIYVSDDFMYDSFLRYATTHKFWIKQDYKSYDNKQDFIDSEGNIVNGEHFTIYTDTDFEQYPYIDTFQYGNDGELNNYSGDYTYNCTDGTREGDEDQHSGESYDDINDRWIDEDYACWITSGDRCYRDRCCNVEDCVSIGEYWYYKEDSNIVEVGGEYYKTDSEEICMVDGDYHLVDDCCYSDRDNEYYLTDDCVYSDEHSDWILKSDAVEVCGNYFHKDDVLEVA